ncbi:homoserine kinase [Candidatus Riflebacteria bacterium]
MNNKENKWSRACAFAPASVGNAVVGFDILGFAFDVLGDRVEARLLDRPVIEIESINGRVRDLPTDPEKNTASFGLLSLIKDCDLPYGFSLKIEKGIPLGSGLGGSAASAVAGVLAVNALLPQPLQKEELFSYALKGESVSSGSVHPDNVAPCLFGGLRLILPGKSATTTKVPFPGDLLCALIHPHFILETRKARGILNKEISMEKYVQQSSYLATFISACYQEDLSLLTKSLRDVIIEPQRASLIPGFKNARQAALDAGAHNFSISGAGPSVFSFVENRNTGIEVAKRVREIFSSEKISSSFWISPLDNNGAKLEWVK